MELKTKNRTNTLVSHYHSLYARTIAHKIQSCPGFYLVICPDIQSVAALEAAISFFDPSLMVQSFIDYQTLPYDRLSPAQNIINKRLECLYHLKNQQQGVLLVSITTLMHYLAPPAWLYQTGLVLEKGQRLDATAFKKTLVCAGYSHTNQVQEPGEFAMRGSIIDLYPTMYDEAIRIDLFDSEIDSLRVFAPPEQTSYKNIDRIKLLAAREFSLNQESIEHFCQGFSALRHHSLSSPIYKAVKKGNYHPGLEYYLPLLHQSKATLFDYLPARSKVLLFQGAKAQQAEFMQQVHQRFDEKQYDHFYPALEPVQLFLSPNALKEKLASMSLVTLSHRTKTGPKIKKIAHQVLGPIHIDHQDAQHPWNRLQTFLEQNHGIATVFIASSKGRCAVLEKHLQKMDIKAKRVKHFSDVSLNAGGYYIIDAPLGDGFKQNDLIVITEAELFQMTIKLKKPKAKPAKKISKGPLFDISDIEVGDPVVHIDHGVGRFAGLETLNTHQKEEAFIKILYQDEDKLYVPVADLDLLSLYSSDSTMMDHIPLDTLGKGRWGKAKKKAAQAIYDCAGNLLDIYAQRAHVQKSSLIKADLDYPTFCEQFAFVPTPDQQKATDAIAEDLQSPKPMDRLLCGDVGFGKTEVAMRAAFLVAKAKKVVVILVPTTLLAKQHYESFRDRFYHWPIQVRMVSRFSSGKERQALIADLDCHKIDILIGTHALLQLRPHMQDLGLFIIDEEHRFGVKQKEHISQMRANIDILTMSATPIPRSLNMALNKVRDITIINTPPQDRLAVTTMVKEHDDHIIHEAILRESARGGQVYYLYNDVATIEKCLRIWQSKMPELRFAIAHGQMAKKELHQTMRAFYYHHVDVLIATTIIESGIDNPQANTLIIDRAEKLGLAQLHQIRGRVGRSHQQAYAYLLTPPAKLIEKTAQKRLRAIEACSGLGAGLELAHYDLDIRGGGAILGEEQSGQIQAIGYPLYISLLEKTIKALESGKQIAVETLLKQQKVQLETPFAAFIPDAFMNDIPQRLYWYKKIASAPNIKDLQETQAALKDQYGSLPKEAIQLIANQKIALDAQRKHINAIKVYSDRILIHFDTQQHFAIEPLIGCVSKRPQRYQMLPPAQIKIHHPISGHSEISPILDQFYQDISP